MATQLRVLVVEDHPDTLRAMAKLLAGDGHEVATAEGVNAARKAAQQKKFDLLLCDLGLRDGDGCELLCELQKLHGLKGIAITGHSMPEDTKRSKDAGFACHLVKPVTMEQLRLAIERTTLEGNG